MMAPRGLVVHAVCMVLLGAAARAGAADECPSSLWIQFKSGCYIFLPAALKNSFGIDKARQLCKVSGADIISINDEEENAFITEMLRNESQGLENVFLGLFFDTDENTFKWFDNSEVTFTNWMEEEITDELLNTCAALHAQSGRWRKINCEGFTEMVTLCKTTLNSQRKKVATEQKVLISSLVIVFSMLVSIVAIVLAVQCKRTVRSSRRSSKLHQPATITPFSDESVLVDAEEGEFSA